MYSREELIEAIILEKQRTGSARGGALGPFDVENMDGDTVRRHMPNSTADKRLPNLGDDFRRGYELPSRGGHTGDDYSSMQVRRKMRRQGKRIRKQYPDLF